MIKDLYRRLISGETIPFTSPENPGPTWGMKLSPEGHEVVMQNLNVAVRPIRKAIGSEEDFDQYCEIFNEVDSPA